jgi:low temperature requirement protein LtrA
MATFRHPLRVTEAARDQPVTTLELFFDLVFVFALTQITALMAHDLTWGCSGGAGSGTPGCATS